MVINHNMAAMQQSGQLRYSARRLEESSKKLGSGYRIVTDKDDAAGLCISEKMRHQVRGLNRAYANVTDGIGLTQTADGALEETQSVLGRMVELTTQAANDINTEADRDAIQNEIEQMKSEIDRIANETCFNEQYMLAEGTPKANPGFFKIQAGSLGGQEIIINFVNASKESLGVDKVDVSTNESASKSITLVQKAIDTASMWRDEFGSTQETLEHAGKNLQKEHENTQSVESQIRDVDMGEEVVKYTRNQILVNAAQSLLAQYNKSPESTLILLQ